MIISLLLNFVILVFGMLFVFLPVVDIASIPYVGSFIASALTSMILVWNAFLVTFPYAELPYHIVIYVLLPFEITMLIGKFFFGHRMPSREIN